MGAPAVGSVVVVAFPYADFSQFKKRPALVVGRADFDNLILCQITSKILPQAAAVALQQADFADGSLGRDSFVRYDKLFTVEPDVVQGIAGVLTAAKLAEIHRQIRHLFGSE